MKIKEKEGKFVIVDYDESEVYRIACAIEKDGIWFYAKILEKTNNDASKNMLQLLIDEERKHLKFFKELLYSLRRQGEEENEDNDLLTSLDYGIFRPFQSMPNITETLFDYRKVLAMGIAVENKSIRFYEACKEKISSETTKTGLQAVIEQERKHKAFFEEMLKKFIL